MPLARVALRNLGAAECGERAIHGAGLVPVFPVADAHLALIRLLLRWLELAEKVAFALALDGCSHSNVTAGAERAVLEDLHRTLASGRGFDHVDDLVQRHRRVLTDHRKRRTGAKRHYDGQNGRTGSKTHRELLPKLPLGQSTP